METNEVIEVITVGELIAYLNRFPLTAAVLKSDMLATGYSRFRFNRLTTTFDVVRNPEPSDCEFLDAARLPESNRIMKAVIL